MVRTTVHGSGATTITAEPLTPSLLAEMVLCPGDTAVTTPLAFTVATVGAEELHCTGRSVNSRPALLRKLALSVTGARPRINSAVDGVIETPVGAAEVRKLRLAWRVTPAALVADRSTLTGQHLATYVGA